MRDSEKRRTVTAEAQWAPLRETSAES
jgi:hypothetical protein